MTDDDPAALGGAPPKLTIGQRILTALPTLQRPAAPAPPTPPAARPGRPTRPPTSKPGGGARPGKSGAGRDDGVLVGETDDTADDTDDDGAEAVDGAADTVDGADAADGATPRSGGRLGALLNPAAAGGRTRTVDNLDEMTREEITHRIKRLDDRERFLALTAAPFGVAVGVLLTVVAIHLNPSLMLHGKLNPKHESTSLIWLEGGVRLLLSGVVVACTLTRRRSLVGFALLFLGTSMGSPLFALPFWALGGYLIWRVFKYQRRPDRTRRGPAARRQHQTRPRQPPCGGARRRGRSDGERAQARRRSKKEPAPTGPPPSKRYTPPRPTRPRPPAPPS